MCAVEKSTNESIFFGGGGEEASTRDRLYDRLVTLAP